MGTDRIRTADGACVNPVYMKVEKKGVGDFGMKEWMKRTFSLSLRPESRSRKVLFSSTAPLKALNSLFYSRTKLKLKHI